MLRISSKLLFYIALLIACMANVAAQSVAKVAASPAAVTGGKKVNGFIRLTAAAPAGGAVVMLSSDNAAATVPASVTVPAHRRTAGFLIKTSAVAADTVANITATVGSSSQTAKLTIRAAALVAVEIEDDDAAVTGGATLTGFVMLKGFAPVGDAVVSLASDNAALTVPATVTIPAGARRAKFTVTTTAVTADTTVTVTATLNGVSVTTTVDLSP